MAREAVVRKAFFTKKKLKKAEDAEKAKEIA